MSDGMVETALDISANDGLVTGDGPKTKVCFEGRRCCVPCCDGSLNKVLGNIVHLTI